MNNPDHSKAVTMRMVADASGCSVATVSHVINGTRYVSPETTKIVNDTIAMLGYTPNNLAKSLMRNSSSSVGLIFAQDANPYFHDMIGTIQAECFKAGLCVILCDSNDDPKQELELIKDLHQRRVDGIILAPAPDAERYSYPYLKDNDINVVLIDRLDCPDFDQVGMDNQKAIFDLVDHMVRLGHGNIGFLPGHNGYLTSLERLHAFKERTAFHNIEHQCVIADHSNDLQEAQYHAAQLMTQDGKPICTALISGNNLCTIGAVSAARDLKIAIPDNIKLVGVDDFTWADFFDPQLTLMAQPCDQIARAAAQCILSRLQGEIRQAKTIRFAPELKIRRSCGS